MTSKFEYFVVFAEMRTGSNFLEANLNAFDGITCHGEAFNPHFIGYPNKDTLLGVTLAAREKNPDGLLDKLRDHSDGLNGFRYFHDHDPRILDRVLDDPRCAKIILLRNPVDSYVSWKIAQETGQWKLTDVSRRKDAKARFDAEEFESHLARTQDFQKHILNRLQISGQTGFYVSYDDLSSLDVINGIGQFLGVTRALDALDRSLKVQNPGPLKEKVSNFKDMEKALLALDRFDLSRTPVFEPKRAAAVPTYVLATAAPLLYVPIKGGPDASVVQWLADLDGVSARDLHRGFSQKELRQWKRTHDGHRSFTVLRHPALRAYHVFCQHILGEGPQVYSAIRQTLIRRHGMVLPAADGEGDRMIEDLRAAFSTFLKFIKANLAGQTSIRVDAAWCTQTQALQGFGSLMLPDFVFREEDLATDLPELARRVGLESAPAVIGSLDEEPFPFRDVYCPELEALVAEAYQRDYKMFGFKPWTPRQAA